MNNILRIGVVLAAACQIGWGADIPDSGLSTAGAGFAPLDVSKAASKDPLVPMSSEERLTLLKEFKGLVAMALDKSSYDRWTGRPMSDCFSSESINGATDAPAGWHYRCEMITGEGDGFYYFYPSEARRGFTLQHVDIRIEAFDAKLIDEMRSSLHPLLGQSIRPPEGTRPVATARGPVHHWETSADIAYLFDDVPPSHPQGSVRFLWSRAPLAGTHQARATLSN